MPFSTSCLTAIHIYGNGGLVPIAACLSASSRNVSRYDLRRWRSSLGREEKTRTGVKGLMVGFLSLIS